MWKEVVVAQFVTSLYFPGWTERNLGQVDRFLGHHSRVPELETFDRDI